MQDHRQKFSVSLKHRFWKKKWEQWNQQEGILKHLKKRGSEDKRFWRSWRHQKHLFRSWSPEVDVIRTIWRSSEAGRLKNFKMLFKSHMSLQKIRRIKQRLFQMDLKAFDAYSVESVEKGLLYEATISTTLFLNLLVQEQ